MGQVSVAERRSWTSSYKRKDKEQITSCKTQYLGQSMKWADKGETNTEVIVPEFLKLHTLYKTICNFRHFFKNKVFSCSLFVVVFFFNSKNGTAERWSQKSRRVGRLAMGGAKCILVRDVQPGGWSYVCGGGAECAFYLVEGLKEVQIQPRRQGKWGGEWQKGLRGMYL